MAKDRYVNKKIAIIGGGHMGCALAEGLARGEKILSSRIWIADPTFSKIAHLKKYNIKVTTDNSLAVSKADIIFIAVKPGVIKEAMREIRESIKDKLVVSVASIPTINKLKTTIDKSQKIARIMPNLAVKYNKGVIGYFRGNISKMKEITLLNILFSLGTIVPVRREEDIDTIDVISACGPAIASTFIEMMTDYAKKKGVSEKAASKIIMQMFIGTLHYLKRSNTPPSEFIRSVATKGGITETILKNLNKDFKEIFIQAMEKGHMKTKKLNDVW